ILNRDHVSHGSVVLLSDLGDAPNDRAQLSAAVISYLREGIPLRVVAIHPTAEDERFFRGLLRSRPIQPRANGSSPVATDFSSNGLPVTLFVVAAVFLVLLALKGY